MPEIEKSCKTCINELLKKTEAPCLYCNLASKEYRGGDGIYWISDLNKDHQKEQTNKTDISYEERSYKDERRRLMEIQDCTSDDREANAMAFEQLEQLALAEGKRQERERIVKLIEMKLDLLSAPKQETDDKEER